MQISHVPFEGFFFSVVTGVTYIDLRATRMTKRASSALPRSHSRHQRNRWKKKVFAFEEVSQYTGSNFDENLRKIVWQPSDEEGDQEVQGHQQQHNEQGDDDHAAAPVAAAT